MLIATLVLAALLPFAFVAFLYREAGDARGALFSIASVISVVLVLAVLLLLDA